MACTDTKSFCAAAILTVIQDLIPRNFWYSDDSDIWKNKMFGENFFLYLSECICVFLLKLNRTITSIFPIGIRMIYQNIHI